jgi:hypothetical protein
MIRRLQSLFAETTPLKDVYRSDGEIKDNLGKEGCVGNPSFPPSPVPSWRAIVGQLQPGGPMGVAKEWEPWSWDLWNTPQAPDDDSAILELLRQKLDEALHAGRESDTEPQDSDKKAASVGPKEEPEEPASKRRSTY